MDRMACLRGWNPIVVHGLLPLMVAAWDPHFKLSPEQQSGTHLHVSNYAGPWVKSEEGIGRGDQHVHPLSCSCVEGEGCGSRW